MPILLGKKIVVIKKLSKKRKTKAIILIVGRESF
jgi:hypothetical protein